MRGIKFTSPIFFLMNVYFPHLNALNCNLFFEWSQDKRQYAILEMILNAKTVLKSKQERGGQKKQKPKRRKTYFFQL